MNDKQEKIVCPHCTDDSQIEVLIETKLLKICRCDCCGKSFEVKK